MPKCRNCNEPITFAPNPSSWSGKLMPVNPDGSCHFHTCKNSKLIQRLRYLREMGGESLDFKDPPKEEVISGG